MSSRQGRGGGDWRWREEEVEPDLAHDPLDLLRGCLLRASGWSAVVGLLLGASASVLSAMRGYSAGVLISATPWVWNMAILGAAQGAVIGLALGALTGVALAAATLVGGMPSRPARRQRRVLGGIAAAIGVGGLGGWLWLVAASGSPLRPGLGDTLLGLAVAGLGGWWVGTRVARWLAETGGREQ
jgi:hypothetical protein